MYNHQKKLLSQYSEKIETYDKKHTSIQRKMEERRIEAANMKKLYMEKTNSLTRLRNKQRQA